MAEPILPTSTSSKAARRALIQAFSIEKLYGYRSISLSSAHAATILIAKNGAGKTTLLGAMDAFLKFQLGRLRDLPFEEIRCKIRDVEDELTLTHDDVIEFLRFPESIELSKLSSRLSVEPSAMFKFVLDSPFGIARDHRYNPDDRLGTTLRRSYNYSYNDADAALDVVRHEVYSRVPNALRLWETLKVSLKDIEVVYLPTYRRVELALNEESSDSYGRRKPPQFSIAAGSLHTGDIQFGLADIQERLRDLNENIVGSSNNGYRKISANIINDLLDGSFSRHVSSSQNLPAKEELSLFFSRLKEGRRVLPFDEITAPQLEKLSATSDMPEASRQFLSYFLAQLRQVIDATKDVEAPVDNFVNMCNKYLSSEEPSTEIDAVDSFAGQKDGKLLRLNRRNFSIQVEILPSGRKISINALSSGEKQMISLFAKLYLYPKRKLVLIDEPELSLSIDWQSEILVDVIDAPLCEQVVAITHSPFVFDNELDPFARSLVIRTDDGPRKDYGAEDDFVDGFGDAGE